MINHVRTLLLNQSGPASVFLPGEEYVPPDYREVLLPAGLMAAREAIFGGFPDRGMLLYRVRQLMAVIHASSMVEFVTQVDPRLTYLPIARGGYELEPGLVVSPLGNAPPLTVLGDLPLEQNGQTSFNWLVNVSSDGQFVTCEIVGLVRQTTTLVFSAGLSSPVPLPGSALSIVVPVAAHGAYWSIKTIARPNDGLPVVARRLAVSGAAALASLFGIGREEPYLSWSNLWESTRPLPDRLAAVTLALAYQTDKVRMGTP